MRITISNNYAVQSLVLRRYGCICSPIGARSDVLESPCPAASINHIFKDMCSFMVVRIDLEVIVEQIALIRIVQRTIALLTGDSKKGAMTGIAKRANEKETQRRTPQAGGEAAARTDQ
jgi:hypothetical protein